MTNDENCRSPHLKLAHELWQKHLSPQDLAVDATCGNGHDTLYLSSLLPQGHIFAFDIQPQAIRETKGLLEKNLSSHQLLQITLRMQSHALWDESTFPKAPRLIVYNLGYLPGGDKSVTTNTETTVQSIKSGLNLLEKGGALSITCYPGHEEGMREEMAILEFAASLSSKIWLVCHHRFANRPKSPSLFWIVHLKK